MLCFHSFLVLFFGIHISDLEIKEEHFNLFFLNLTSFNIFLPVILLVDIFGLLK
jgi:hypothetical protein